jgi:hypothetical protein
LTEETIGYQAAHLLILLRERQLVSVFLTPGSGPKMV